MQAQHTRHSGDSSMLSREDQQRKLLLVGKEEGFRNLIKRQFFGEQQFLITGRSITLLDALAHLKSGEIDLAIVSSEFCEEELSLFAFDAQRCGFTGLILRVVSPPNKATRVSFSVTRELPDWHLAQLECDDESPKQSVGRVSRQQQLSSRRLTSGAQAGLKLNELHGSRFFTAKEEAVLMRVSEGWTNQQIADYLKCSEGSVKAILQQLFTKLGVRKRAQIVRMAFENTLLWTFTMLLFPVFHHWYS